MTEESKKRLSDSRKGIVFSEEHKMKLKKAHTGIRLSENHRKAIKKGAKGFTGIHSEETRRIISENKKGSKSNFWRGGITQINKQIRGSLEYRLWRESVFKRDNYTCVWCSSKSGNGKTVVLNADHIKPFAYFPELRFAIDNGRTLCVPCHMSTDTFGWKIRNYSK